MENHSDCHGTHLRCPAAAAGGRRRAITGHLAGRFVDLNRPRVEHLPRDRPVEVTGGGRLVLGGRVRRGASRVDGDGDGLSKSGSSKTEKMQLTRKVRQGDRQGTLTQKRYEVQPALYVYCIV